MLERRHEQQLRVVTRLIVGLSKLRCSLPSVSASRSPPPGERAIDTRSHHQSKARERDGPNSKVFWISDTVEVSNKYISSNLSCEKWALACKSKTETNTSSQSNNIETTSIATGTGPTRTRHAQPDARCMGSRNRLCKHIVILFFSSTLLIPDTDFQHAFTTEHGTQSISW